jgi:hypothetical protein
MIKNKKILRNLPKFPIHKKWFFKIMINFRWHFEYHSSIRWTPYLMIMILSFPIIAFVSWDNPHAQNGEEWSTWSFSLLGFQINIGWI